MVKFVEGVEPSEEEMELITSDPVEGGEFFFLDSKTGLPWSAHEGQRLVMRDQHKDITICAGRRWGKTAMMGVWTLHFALFNPNSVQFVLAPTQDQSNRLFTDAIVNMIQASRIADMIESVSYGGKKENFPCVTLTNGSKIKAYSTANHGDYLRGNLADRVVVDEAAFVNEDVFQVIAPMLIDKDGVLIKISTPNGHNLFYRDFLRGQNVDEADYSSWHFTTDDNPHLPKQAIARLFKDQDEFKVRTERYAEFISDQNKMFTWESISKSMYDPVKEEDFRAAPSAEPGHMYVMGADLAREIDYTVITILDVTDQAKVKVRWVDRFNKQSYEYIIQAIKSWAGIFQPFGIMVDSTGAGNPLLERLQMELPQVEGFVFSNAGQNPKKEYLIRQLKLGMEQSRLWIPTVFKDTLEELKDFEYTQNKETGMWKLGAPSRGHDDAVISLSLAWSYCANPLPDLQPTGVSYSEKKPRELTPESEGTIDIYFIDKERDSEANPFDKPDYSDNTQGGFSGW